MIRGGGGTREGFGVLEKGGGRGKIGRMGGPYGNIPSSSQVSPACLSIMNY